ncbi:MAG: tetratricopeptide repeat protein [Saprospiraceae bacterium]|nr:tetratricopeptide repeat protein [Saprospiraceae bacterium]
MITTLKNISTSALIVLAFCYHASGQSNALAENYVQQAINFKKNMKPDSAIVYYEKASMEFNKLGNIEKLIDSYNQIGIILTRQDQYELAKTYLNKALSTGLSTLDANNLDIATTYISLGVIYNAEENYQQSLIYHYKALNIRLIKLGAHHADVATSYGNIGNVHRNNKDYDLSIDAHLKALSIREKVFGPNSAEIIESYVGLGNTYRESKAFDTALEHFEKALKNKIIQRGEGHKDLVKFYKYISDVCYLKGDQLKGDEYKTKYKEIEQKSQ